MFTSIAGLPRLVLLMLSGMFLLSLSGDPAPAQAPGTLALGGGAPGQVREVIAPAATVIRTLHYQAVDDLTCDGFVCTGDFANPGKRRRLNVTRIACHVRASSGSTFSYGYIALKRPGDVHLLFQYVPVDYSSPNGHHTLNRAVDIQVRGAQHIGVALVLVGTAIQGSCFAAGALEVLQ